MKIQYSPILDPNAIIYLIKDPTVFIKLIVQGPRLPNIWIRFLLCILYYKDIIGKTEENKF